MADNIDDFSGYRYLTDAGNTRQYAVRFENGQPQKPIQVFAQDGREAHFNPNETIFAIDDNVKGVVADGSLRLSALVYQITTDEDGQPSNLKYHAGANFEAFPAMSATSDDALVIFKMTPETESKLTSLGFDPGFPRQFSERLDPRDMKREPDGSTSIDPVLVLNLPFPPHHPGGAAVARENVQKQTTTPTTRPRDRFNNNAGTGTQTQTPVKKPRMPSAPRGGWKVADGQLEEALMKYAEDLSEKAQRGKLDPVVGREEDIVKSIKVLSRRKQSSLCFTGEAGVGKTAMFSGIAQYIADGKDVPDSLNNARVLSLDLTAMTAGTKFRGQFEERLMPIVEGLKEREGFHRGRKIILAIDELHNAMGMGKAEGSQGAGDILKPFLTSQGITTMGSTTLEEYRKHIEKDGALASRFEPIQLDEPKPEATKQIIKRLWPLQKEHHGLEVDPTDKEFDYLINMTTRYAPNQHQPRKAEKALDTAGSSAEFRHSKKIEKEDLIAAVAQMSGLSAEFLGQNDAERFLKMEQELPQQVLGQPGVKRVTDGLIGSRSGLNDPNQPWGAFVFQGPTGTGKTELCKAISRYLFGTEDALIQLNMGEYSEKHTVSRLIGAPPGYVGFDTAEPALTEKIRQRPYSVLLLDEIEKAHPDVFNVLLPVLNDGKMTDNQGKTVLFNNVIVVMTTNLGAEEAMALLSGKAGMSFGGNVIQKSPEEQQAELDKVYTKARGKLFRPEMVNRIEELGGFVTFIPLAEPVIAKLVSREIDKVNKRLSDPSTAALAGITVEVSDDVKAQLAKEGYKPDMGARPLRKVVREKVANPLGKWLMAHKDEVVKFAAENGGAKLLIKSLDAAIFAPEMVPGGVPVAAATSPAAPAVNDNATELPAEQRKAAPPVIRKPLTPPPSGPKFGAGL